ncbi:MAG: hypothetical protein WCG61_06045 [Chlorobium sp.]
MDQDDLEALQSWRRGKEQMLSDMGNVFNAAIELEKRIYELQKMLNESQWFLGEERVRRETLERDLHVSVEQCHALRTQLDRQMRDFKLLQQELQDARLFLGEESKMAVAP